MRRALIERLPLLARLYGIRPWDIDQMTYREISEFLRDIDRLHEQQETGG